MNKNFEGKVEASKDNIPNQGIEGGKIGVVRIRPERAKELGKMTTRELIDLASLIAEELEKRGDE